MTQRTVEDRLREEYFLQVSSQRRRANSSTSNGVDPLYNLYARFGSL